LRNPHGRTLTKTPKPYTSRLSSNHSSISKYMNRMNNRPYTILQLSHAGDLI